MILAGIFAMCIIWVSLCFYVGGHLIEAITNDDGE